MEINLVFLLIDLGTTKSFLGSDGNIHSYNFSFYKDAAVRMIESARRVMPHVKITQLTDSVTRSCPGVDKVERYPEKVEKSMLMVFKGFMFYNWVLESTSPTIFCDVDLIWHRTPEEIFDQEFDLAVLWREQYAQPYNCGILFTKPTVRSKGFWKIYRDTISEMPFELHRWWGDQLALAVLLGQSVPGQIVKACGADVLILDMNDVAPAEPGSGFATHFKGPLKTSL